MKIKSLFILIAISVASLFFVACPYSANFPLTNPSITIDQSFLGKWVVANEYSDNPNYFIFSKIDDKKFKAEKYEYDSSDEIYSVSGTYICHFTDIDKTRFVNMKDNDTYYFYKIEMQNDKQFKLFEVTDNIDEKFTSSQDLLAFFTKHKNLSFFYNKDEETYNKE